MLEATIAGKGTYNEYPMGDGTAYRMKRTRPPIVCADGFEISAQGSRMHQCRPKGDLGPYTHLEVMFYGETPADWPPYENGGVFSDVPVDLIRALVASHGGEMEV